VRTRELIYFSEEVLLLCGWGQIKYPLTLIKVNLMEREHAKLYYLNSVTVSGKKSPVVGFYEHGNELLGFLKDEEFII
jgi:hypothetical protein